MQQAEAIITTRKEEETAHIGALLGSSLVNPVVIALEGGLGAGKTVFVRGAARGLGIADRVTSPTFVLLKIYNGRLPLYHFDFYRLGEEEDSSELGFEDYLPGDGAAFVEWPERLPSLLPPRHLRLVITAFHDRAGEGRRLAFYPAGAEAAYLVEAVIEAVAWGIDGTMKLPRP